MRSSRQLGSDDLVAAYFLLARAGRDGVGRTSWRERVEAAASAGFAGIGVMPHDYLRACETGEADELAGLLDDADLCIAEIDGFPVRWSEESDERRRREDAVFELADRFAVRHVIYPLVPPGGELPERSLLLDELARVCDRASEHDLVVSVEFVPFVEPIGDVASTWDLVAEVDRENCGVNVDFWHHHAGRNDSAALRAVPGDRITGIHFTDGSPDLSEPDPMKRTQRQRKLPGDGTFPMVDTLRTLRANGCATPMTLEVVTIEHLALPVDEFARLAFDASRRVMDAAAV